MVDTIRGLELWEGLRTGSIPRVVDMRNEDDIRAAPFDGPPGTMVDSIPIWRALDEPEQLAGAIEDGTALVCALGHGAEMVVDMLAESGRRTVALEGGMAAWARLLVAVEIGLPPGAGIRVWQVLRPAKGCLSYVIGVPGRGAVVVDPARFVAPYLELVESAGMQLVAVVDTHLHADHISGGAELARTAGVPYLLPAGDCPEGTFPGGDPASLELDPERRAEIIRLHLPGHTPGSTAVSVPGVLLAAGDTLFPHGVGRPDLTGQAEVLARQLHASIHDRLAGIPADTRLLAAHWSRPEDIGADGTVVSRLGDVLGADHLTGLDVDRFVEQVAATLAPAPPSYDRIREINAGAEAGEEELEILEVGRNQCSAGMRPS
ncbi:MAG: MBL fold metallo-hydrolase [Acidimicrobiales bacterium]